MAKGKGTKEPHLSAILTAQSINRLAAGNIVAPWELWKLPEEWLDAFGAMAYDYPEMREGQKKVDAKLAELRKPKHGNK